MNRWMVRNARQLCPAPRSRCHNSRSFPLAVWQRSVPAPVHRPIGSRPVFRLARADRVSGLTRPPLRPESDRDESGRLVATFSPQP
jgi:hypothetical protein